MSLLQKARVRLSRSKTGRRLLEDLRYRMVAAAGCSFLLNLLYACYHGVVGVIYHSVWFLTMCAYYVLLGVMRFSAVLCGRRNTSSSAGTAYFGMRLSGVLLVLLSLVLSGVTYISLSQNIAAKHDEIMMITIAAYTFFKLTMAVIRAVRQRKNPSPLLAVIRSIGYAEAAASVFTLQRSMLVSFGSMSAGKIHTMNVLTGAAVCLFVFLLGLRLVVRGVKERMYQNGKIKNCNGKRKNRREGRGDL